LKWERNENWKGKWGKTRKPLGLGENPLAGLGTKLIGPANGTWEPNPMGKRKGWEIGEIGEIIPQKWGPVKGLVNWKN